MRPAAVIMLLLLSACAADDDVPGHAQLVRQVEENRVGRGADNWIEMRNITGAWERTGLIFGYSDDYGECSNAISGLKQANPARDYRCIPAN